MHHHVVLSTALPRTPHCVRRSSLLQSSLRVWCPPSLVTKEDTGRTGWWHCIAISLKALLADGSNQSRGDSPKMAWSTSQEPRAGDVQRTRASCSHPVSACRSLGIALRQEQRWRRAHALMHGTQAQVHSSPGQLQANILNSFSRSYQNPASAPPSGPVPPIFMKEASEAAHL